MLNRLVAGVAPLPADEVGDEDDEDQPCQGATHGDGDQHVVLIQLTFFHFGDKWEHTIFPWVVSMGPYKLTFPSSLPLPTAPQGRVIAGRRLQLQLTITWRSSSRGRAFRVAGELWMRPVCSPGPLGSSGTLTSHRTASIFIFPFTGRRATLYLKMTTFAQMVMCSHLTYAGCFESKLNTGRGICSKNLLDWESSPPRSTPPCSTKLFNI